MESSNGKDRLYVGRQTASFVFGFVSFAITIFSSQIYKCLLPLYRYYAIMHNLMYFIVLSLIIK